ncbi:MAG: xanthine dehydrogenase FAD-binding subunit XdhB [Lachnospiraceae bacterium]|nr:xanthine dehydrogenase FAD-binding subunit XdhB [Lachnospiraceae bacterium]
MYDISAIYEAESTAHAVELLLAHPEAKIIAGGSDVLIKVREGRMAGCELVSIYGLDELRGVTMDEEGTIRIGSLTSFSHIHKDPIVKKHLLALSDAVNMVGGPQVRAIGTIGGNTCNGVTSADSASTLFAYDAVLEITGPEGIRMVPIEEFYLGPGKVDLRPGELETAVCISKKSWSGYKGFYIKYGMRNAMEIATTGCSVNVKLSQDKKTIRDVRIGFGVAAPTPMRAHGTEEKVRGMEVSPETRSLIGDSVLEEVRPRDSWRASKDFRLHLCKTMAMRAFTEAVRRAGGELDD